MIDERFARSAFESRGIASAAARILADELAAEIQSEFQKQLVKYASTLVARLNAMGHELAEVEDAGVDEFGGVSYRDEAAMPEKRCKLLVAIDFTVTTGYAHLLSASDLESPDED